MQDKNSEQKNTAKKKRKKNSSRLTTVIIVLILLIGLAIIAYPTFSDWWNSFHQSRAIASYSSVVEEADNEMMDEMLAAADAYNKKLLSMPNRYLMEDEEREEYESLLDLAGNGVMGYIQINSIGVNLPIYHGVDESILQVAIGHIEGTSLPVGGTSTHSAVSGHRGLPSAKLFTDLDKLKTGDVFTITVLNRIITYEVDKISVVEPEDVSELNIEAGKDYCTLITCTPYGINTHRLLVRGHRIENVEGEVVVLPGAVQIPTYIVIPAVGIPMLFIALMIMLIYYRFRRPLITKNDRERLLKNARDRASK